MSEIEDILSFSPTLPERDSFIHTLQIAWDSTSIGVLKECPFKYYLSIVCGIIPQGDSVHLKFGLIYHSSIELYHRERARGLDREEAIILAVKFAFNATWEPRLNRPWISDHETKNRKTLLRTLLNYLDNYNDEVERLQTVILPDGTPAVELSFRFNTNYETPTGVPYKICGHIDRLADKDGRYFVCDYKTTSQPLNEQYWDQYSPNNQLSLYYYAGQIIFERRISGLIIEAARITKDSAEFERRQIDRSEAQLEEWYKDLGYWLAMAELFSKSNYWPKNEKSCKKGYLTCEYINICNKCPNVRANWMKSGYAKRVWDPMQNRGEDSR